MCCQHGLIVLLHVLMLSVVSPLTLSLSLVFVLVLTCMFALLLSVNYAGVVVGYAGVARLRLLLLLMRTLHLPLLYSLLVCWCTAIAVTVCVVG